MTYEMMIIIAGAILIAVAAIGDGFEIKAIRLPRLNFPSRLVTLIAGVGLIALGVWLQQPKEEPQPPDDVLSVIG